MVLNKDSCLICPNYIGSAALGFSGIKEKGKFSYQYLLSSYRHSASARA